MKIKSFLVTGLCLFITCLGANSPSALSAERALIYKGPGACTDGCHQAAYEMAIRAGYAAEYVSPNTLHASSTKEDKTRLFENVAFWIQPGGKSSTAMRTMTAELKDTLVQYVKNGGGYVGFCAGAFATTSLVGSTQNPGLGILPGKTTWYEYPREAGIIPLNWNGKTRHVYWEGGPYHSEIPAGEAEITATYPDGSAASVRSHYGQGKVYVTGLHPEAPQDWRRYFGLKDPDGLDYDLVMEMITWVTSKND